MCVCECVCLSGESFSFFFFWQDAPKTDYTLSLVSFSFPGSGLFFFS